MSTGKSYKRKKKREHIEPIHNNVTYTTLHLISICSLLCAGIILYFKALNAPFLFDSSDLLEAFWLKSPEKFFNYYFTNGSFYKHRILPYASFALNWYFNKNSTFGYHVVNLALHILNSFLIYLITLKLLSIKVTTLHKTRFSFFKVTIRDERERIYLSCAVAFLFLCHPIQTNAVLYVIQRIEAMMAFFYLSSFYLFIQAVHFSKDTLRKGLLFAGSFFAFMMAFYSKEVSLTIPVMMLVSYWIFGVKREDITLRKYTLVLLSAGCIIGLTTYILFSSGRHSNFPLWTGPHLGFRWGIKENLYTQANVIIEYIKLLMLPLPSKLSLDHAFPLYKSIVQYPTYLSLFTIAALIFFALFKAKKFPHLCFCILWWFVVLIPSSSIWPIWDIMVEYRTYLPGFGFYLLLVLSTHQAVVYFTYCRHWITPKHSMLAQNTIVILLVFSYMLGTYERVSLWKEPLPFWRDVVKKAPHRARTHINLGNAYNRAGELDKAISAYKKGLAINPNHVKAHINLGEVYCQKKMLDEAIAQHKKALALKPYSAEGHAGLGAAYLKKGMHDEAILELKQTLAIKPYYSVAHANLCAAYQLKDMFDEAITECTRALEMNPTLTIAYVNLGIAYGKKGLFDQAISEFTHVLRTNPDSVDAYYYRAIAHDEKGMLDEAIADFEKALTFAPNSVNARFKLAMVYSKNGMQDEANAQFKEAFTLQAARKGSSQITIPSSPAKTDKNNVQSLP